MKFKDRLNQAMIENGFTATDLCNRTGIPKSAMSQYRSGAFEPKADRLKAIADALGKTEAWLMGYDAKPNAEIPEQIQVPLFASVSAGFGSTREEAIGTFPVTGVTGDIIAVLVSGDSMSPTIADGDTIIVKRQSSVDYGDVAVVRVDDEHFVKKFEYTPEYIRLVSLNPSYQPIVLTGQDILRCTVEGKVIGSYKRW